MSNYFATVKWQRNGEDFLGNKYSRAHVWQFDGGAEVAASASPQIVPAPWSLEENVDPEEAFVASLSSCHMLFFLAIAAKKGFQIDSYSDQATGTMAKSEEGKHMMAEVTLKPEVSFSGGKLPDQDTIESIHHLAHDKCFIANSVKTRVVIDF